MVSEQPTRKMQKELKGAGWVPLPGGDGSHTKYGCPCGKHTRPLPEGHRTISAGVVRKVRSAIEECKRSQQNEEG